MDSVEILFWLLGGLAAAGSGVALWLNSRSERGRENLGKRIGAVDDKVGEVATDAAVLKADRDRANARLELLEKAAEKAVCKADLEKTEKRLADGIKELAEELREMRKK